MGQSDERIEKIDQYHLQIKEIAIDICKKFNCNLEYETLIEAIMKIRKLVKEGKLSKEVEDILWRTNANDEHIQNGMYIDKIFEETEEDVKKLIEELKGVLL